MEVMVAMESFCSSHQLTDILPGLDGRFHVNQGYERYRIQLGKLEERFIKALGTEQQKETAGKSIPVKETVQKEASGKEKKNIRKKNPEAQSGYNGMLSFEAFKAKYRDMGFSDANYRFLWDQRS